MINGFCLTRSAGKPRNNPVNQYLDSSSEMAIEPQEAERSGVPENNGRCFVLISLAAVAIWAAFVFDDATIAWVHAHQHLFLKHVFGAISHYGDWPFLMAAGLAMTCLFAKLRQRRWMRIICIMMVSSTLSGVLVNTARLTTGRTRPNAEAAEGWYGARYHGEWLIGRNEFNSFPSGHTATAIGFVVPLLLLAPPVGVPALFVALLICGSRIYLGAHHLSDVTVSLVIAFWVASMVSRKWTQRWHYSYRISFLPQSKREVLVMQETH